MQRLFTEVRKRHRNQKGFTLIEMLVVISILGILAAVVTLSMVGITNTARTNALKAERQTIQVAFDTMLADQGVSSTAACPQPGTEVNTMDAFPPGGLSGATLTKDQTSPPSPIMLYPKYIHTNTQLQESYSCDSNGVVHGHTIGTGQ